MIKATENDYKKLRDDLDKIKNKQIGGFTNCNFIDYGEQLQQIKQEYKGNNIRIEQLRIGIRASKIKKKQSA